MGDVYGRSTLAPADDSQARELRDSLAAYKGRRKSIVDDLERLTAAYIASGGPRRKRALVDYFAEDRQHDLAAYPLVRGDARFVAPDTIVVAERGSCRRAANHGGALRGRDGGRGHPAADRRAGQRPDDDLHGRAAR